MPRESRRGCRRTRPHHRALTTASSPPRSRQRTHRRRYRGENRRSNGSRRPKTSRGAPCHRPVHTTQSCSATIARECSALAQPPAAAQAPATANRSLCRVKSAPRETSRRRSTTLGHSRLPGTPTTPTPPTSALPRTRSSLGLCSRGSPREKTPRPPPPPSLFPRSRTTSGILVFLAVTPADGTTAPPKMKACQQTAGKAPCPI